MARFLTPGSPDGMLPAARPGLSRDGEAARLWFRTERVISQNGAWYIATREGLDVGPYAHREDARRDAIRLIELLAQKAEFGAQAQMLTIHQFMHRPRFRQSR